MSEEIASRLVYVLDRVQAAVSRRAKVLPQMLPRVVAVSKTKPITDIVSAYKAGQRNFGENYVQELVEKSASAEIVEKCADIKWHFIGHMQRNKVNKLTAIPSLFMVETIDSSKSAKALNTSCDKLGRQGQLNVTIQVNSSHEQSKGGCSLEEVVDVASTIRNDCPHLQLAGLMTIGSFDHDLSEGPNPDFQEMLKCRANLCEELSIDVDSMELSMGMSADYEHAIEVGSTNVRIGSTIFGPRIYAANT